MSVGDKEMEQKASLSTSFFCLYLAKNHCVYILFCKKVNPYCIGGTSDLTNGLNWHNVGEFKRAQTKITDDCEILFVISRIIRIQ